MYTMSSSCISAFSCVASLTPSAVHFFVFIVAILATTSFIRLRNQTRKDEMGNMDDITPMEQIIIDNQNLVSIPGLPPHRVHQHQVLDESSGLRELPQNITNEGESDNVQFPLNSTSIDMPQVLNSSNCPVGPRISTDKVESDENVAARDQTIGETSDPVFLLHQPLIEGRETSSFHIEHPSNMLPEAQETTSGIVNEDSTMTSQPTEQPTEAAADAAIQDIVPELKTAAKVSYWVMPISAGGIGSILSGIIGNKRTDLAHEVILFDAYKSLTFISFVLGVLLFLLTTLKPVNIQRLVIIVKITMWLTLGSIIYAITCATSIIVVDSLVDVVIVLLAPLLVVFVLVVASFCGRRA